jgi:hypothetical protein
MRFVILCFNSEQFGNDGVFSREGKSMKKVFILAFVAFAATIAACGPSTISLLDIEPAPLSLMNAQVSPRTACLVLNPSRVPNEMPVLVEGKHQGGTMADAQEFVKRDLKKAFENYFRKVIVVSPGDPMPTEPHVVIDVKIDRVEVVITKKTQSGAMVTSRGYAAMTWSLGMRPSESKEYLYSFAGECAGTPAAKPQFLIRSMLESSIASMLKGYTDKHVHSEIMKLPVPGAPPAKPGTAGI